MSSPWTSGDINNQRQRLLPASPRARRCSASPATPRPAAAQCRAIARIDIVPQGAGTCAEISSSTSIPSGSPMLHWYPETVRARPATTMAGPAVSFRPAVYSGRIFGTCVRARRRTRSELVGNCGFWSGGAFHLRRNRGIASVSALRSPSDFVNTSSVAPPKPAEDPRRQSDCAKFDGTILRSRDGSQYPPAPPRPAPRR